MHELGEHARKMLDDLRNQDYAAVVSDASTLLSDASEVVDGFLHPPAAAAPGGPGLAPPDLRSLSDDLRNECADPRHRRPPLAAAAGNQGGQPVGFDPARLAKILAVVKVVADLLASLA